MSDVYLHQTNAKNKKTKLMNDKYNDITLSVVLNLFVMLYFWCKFFSKTCTFCLTYKNTRINNERG